MPNQTQDSFKFYFGLTNGFPFSTQFSGNYTQINFKRIMGFPNLNPELSQLFLRFGTLTIHLNIYSYHCKKIYLYKQFTNRS